MEIIYNEQDMISFISWYDNKKEEDCHRTYSEELEEWKKLNSQKESLYTLGYNFEAGM